MASEQLNAKVCFRIRYESYSSSKIFSDTLIKQLEEPGFEPGTFRMRSGHSTTELHPQAAEYM